MTFALWFAADAFDHSGWKPSTAGHSPHDPQQKGYEAAFAISPEEELLLERLKDDDEAALTALVGKYWDPLWRYAYRILRSSDAAADVVQDVLVSLWNRRATLDPKRGVRAYLFAAVRFQTMKVRRHESVVRRAEEQNEPIAVAGVGAYLQEYPVPMDEQTLVATLERVIATLPEQRREILLLRWWHGLTYDEIAEIVGLGVSAIKMQVHRSVIALRPLLEREFK